MKKLNIDSLQYTHDYNNHKNNYLGQEIKEKGGHNE